MPTQEQTINRFPALFIGHGSPMNAIEQNEFSLAWQKLGRSLPRPDAILSISAHWETNGTHITAMKRPKTIHDFYGFPEALYRAQYPAPGAPEWAEKIQKSVSSVDIQLTQEWGLDHGTWSVLMHLFPLADVPVLQLSLDRTQPPGFHYELGQQLAALREHLLILGSGNMVHNLRMIQWEDAAFDWAQNFDRKLADLILSRDHQTLIDYHELGEEARLAIPTNEHFLPLLYILALQGETEETSFFADKVTYGSISMRGVMVS